METLVVVKETLTTVKRIEDNGVGKQDKVVVQNLIEFQKGKVIGYGLFGPRYVASNRETGALCSMKEIELSPNGPISAECLKREIELLSKMKHPNIVEYYGSKKVGDRFHIYQEYVHPGSLNIYINERYGAITEPIVRKFTRQIMSGLAYLHSQYIAHRSIKGANLLVDSCGVVKLADFGMAQQVGGSFFILNSDHILLLSLSTISSHLTQLSGHEGGNICEEGSPYWLAPEAIIYGSHSLLASDIWSLGCTVIEMFTGRPPWSEHASVQEALFKIASGKDTPQFPETLSSEGKNFLRCCLQRNPADRPTAAMLLEHPFLKNSQHTGN
ncbi:hypothetical protein M0R45_004411 [Rubus argutus]|uniref:Protein kinase domain-containing protein n=1 Tax=Rubus argutus TaxID=59490 RepID=A0AAW1YJR1_RUBAR